MLFREQLRGNTRQYLDKEVNVTTLVLPSNRVFKSLVFCSDLGVRTKSLLSELRVHTDVGVQLSIR